MDEDSWHPSDFVSECLTFVFVGWLAGVTYDDRQAAVRRLRVGQQLRVVREPNNPYDSNACAVETLDGLSVGYVPREDAAGVAQSIDRGDKWVGYVGRVSPPAEIPSWGAYVWLGRPRVRKRSGDSLDPKTLPEPGWHPDPRRRHELRYWSGFVWTEYVSDRGRQTLDPLE